MQKQKKRRGSTETIPRIYKIIPPTASDTVKSPCNHNGVFWWDRGSMLISNARSRQCVSAPRSTCAEYTRGICVRPR